MQSPQFSKGQTLTAEALNEISQNLRDLASRVGRAGLASRYVGPSPLRNIPDSTGQPVYLSPADIGGSGGVYLRRPDVEDSLRLSTSAVLAPSVLTRDDGSPLQEGDEIFQKITVDAWGQTLGNVVTVVPSGSVMPIPSTWDPSSGESAVLYHRIGSVIADPRMATSSVTGSDMPFRPFVVLRNDGSVPILPRNAAADSGSVQLVGPLTGSTLPIKTLVAGQGVTLTDYASSVTLTASGGGDIPLAQFNTNTIDPETGQEAAPVPGKIRAVGFTVDDEPSIQNGEILLPLAHDVESGSVTAVGALQTAAAVHDISRPQIMRGELQIPFASSGVPGLISDIQVSESGPALSDGVLILPPSTSSVESISSVEYSLALTAPTVANGVISHPFAGDGVSGVLSGLVFEDSSAVLPYLRAGSLYVPPASSGDSGISSIQYLPNITAPTVANGVISHPFAGKNGADYTSGVLSGLVFEDSSAVLPYFRAGSLYVPPAASGGDSVSAVVYDPNISSPSVAAGVISHPFADSLGSSSVAGVVAGTVTENSGVLAPYFSSGVLFLPSRLQGLITTAGTPVKFAELVTDGAQVSPLASFEFELASGIMTRFTLCAHYSEGYLKFSFRQG